MHSGCSLSPLSSQPSFRHAGEGRKPSTAVFARSPRRPPHAHSPRQPPPQSSSRPQQGLEISTSLSPPSSTVTGLSTAHAWPTLAIFTAASCWWFVAATCHAHGSPPPFYSCPPPRLWLQHEENGWGLEGGTCRVPHTWVQKLLCSFSLAVSRELPATLGEAVC